jgi:hypothetical protein
LGRKKLKEMKNKRFENWAEKESFELAKAHVYSQENLHTSTVKEAPVLLSKPYIETAKAVAEKRVVLAGYRMADLLCKVY